jgi:cell division protein FtsQ
MKAIPKNAMARNTAAADAEAYRPELVESDEPRYLRRQKPVEIRRKKFGGKSAAFYRNIFLALLIAAVCAVSAYALGNFLLHSPKVLLLKPDQVEVTGNHIVAREAVLAPFYRDRGRSVLRIPLDTRRTEIEQISWVQTASIQRILPNRIRVDVSERTPIAFVRNGTELALIDESGVILDRPKEEDFHFPIVTGISEELPRAERGRRMQNYQEFLRDIDLVNVQESRDARIDRTPPSSRVSEVDLSSPQDLRVVVVGLSTRDESRAVTVHFGIDEFAKKYRTLVLNFGQWEANSGCVYSVDLRYARQIPVNADSIACSEQSSTQKKR